MLFPCIFTKKNDLVRRVETCTQIVPDLDANRGGMTQGTFGTLMISQLKLLGNCFIS